MNASTSEQAKLQFQMAYSAFDEVKKQFYIHHSSTISLACIMENEDTDAEENLRKEFENDASEVYASYHTVFQTDQKPVLSTPQPSKPSAKLNPLKIPKFSGDLKQFRHFYEIFSLVVDGDDDRSDVEKYSHLMDALEGPAKAVVQSNSASALNYKAALDALIERYDRPRLIAFAHLQSLDNAPIVTNSNNSKALRSLVDIFTENISALEKMKLPIKQSDFLLFYMLSKHLNDDLLTKFEIQYGNPNKGTFPQYDDLKSFIVNHCHALETVEFSSSLKSQKTSNSQLHCKPENKTKGSNSFQLKPRQANTFFVNAKKSTTYSCTFCKSTDHFIYKCPQFQNKSPPERLSLAHANKWCLNCLSDRHTSEMCRSQSNCRSCFSRHHTMICINTSRNNQPTSVTSPQNPNNSIYNPQFNSATNNYQYYPQNLHATDSLFATSAPLIGATPQSAHVPQIDSLPPQTSPFNTQFNSGSLPRAHPTSDVNFSSPQAQAKQNISLQMQNPQPPTNFCGITSSRSGVLLSTALLEIQDSFGNFHKVRALIDSGSETNYISEKCFKKLHLARFESSLKIQGLNQMEEYTTKGGVSCSIKPIGTSNPILNIDAYILPKICTDMPPRTLKHTHLDHIKNLFLADPKFYEPGPIDLLLGAEIFALILLNNHISGERNEPIAINTIFGYVLIGKYTELNSSFTTATTLFCSTTQTDLFNLNKTLSHFWEIEEIPREKMMSPENELCEKIFRETHSRDATGRYILELPFKNINEPLFDITECRALATKRFLSLENRLYANKELHREYSKIIVDYLKEGFLKPVPDNLLLQNGFIIPHHAVVKPGKVRIVLDGSFKIRGNQPSLNDTLLIGQKLQKDIGQILLNFRLGNITFTCDIHSMFTMLKVAEKHQTFQRILWRNSKCEPIREYMFERVIFGLSCSPFLANRTILQLAQDERDNYPLGARILEHSTYVDDCCSSFNSFQEAKIARDQLIAILKKGGFELGKWSSNTKKLLLDIPESQLQTSLVNFDTESHILKILGLQWFPQDDIFCFTVDTTECKCTKRNILSQIARLYDPLGFLSPVTLFAKSFMQILHTLGLQWDDEPPLEIRERWSQLKDELLLLEKVRIPRLIGIKQNSEVQLHAFGDASMKAYATIEGLLNSRPLTPISSDANDFSVLTPGHFLTLEPISALPDPDLSHLKLNQLSRWQLLQRLHQDFWSRWHTEYLHTLQQKAKWFAPTSPPPKLGTLVIIKQDNVSPSKWNLARITALHPGADDICRVATIRTADGSEFKRPLVKLCPLPEVEISH
ncbi:uncharacterized protein [Leptinotarsa decemlineata]|uniref:uncharacterized protein n=1 Tax=Leptinotarsa decemlineata TaxID=7539 RepID=UPI003D3088AC